MIFTGRSVDALDDVRDVVVVKNDDIQQRRDVSAVAIAAGWFSSLRRPGKKNKKCGGGSGGQQKQAKSAWDLTTLTMVSFHFYIVAPILLYIHTTIFS